MSFHHQPRIVTDGLIAYVDAQNPKSYGNPDPSIWYDMIGGIDASLEPGAVYQNNSIYVPGSTDSGDLSHVNLGDVARPTRITIDMWIMKTGVGSFSNANNFFATSRSTSGSPGGAAYSLGLFEDTGQFYCSVANINDYLPLSVDGFVFQDEWVNVVFIYDGSTKRMWGNNVLAINEPETDDPTYATGDWDWHIGDWGHPVYTRRFKGYIDIFKAYNRALTDEERLQNFNALRSRYGL